MVNTIGKKSTKKSRLNRNKSKKRKQRGGSNLEANLSNDNFSALVKKSYHNNAIERAEMDNLNEPFGNIGSFFKGGGIVPQFSGASEQTTNNLYKIISTNEQAIENGKFDSAMVMNKGGSKKRPNKRYRKKRKRTKKRKHKTYKRKSKKTKK